MFENVIIAINAGPSAPDAVALGRRLLAPGGQLTLAHVWSRPERPRADAGRLAEQRLRRADRLLHSARLATGIDAVAGLGAPEVASGLHALARRRGADLIVVGGGGPGALRRALGGGQLGRMITGAPCPVAVAPRGYHAVTTPIRTVGAGYSDWPTARPLVRLARDLADRHRAGLSLCQSLTAPPGALAYLDTPGFYERIPSGDWDAALELVVLSNNAPIHVGGPDPARELECFSATVDLLVVASSNSSRLARLVHADASRALTRTARCPLIVVGDTARRSGDDRRDGDWSVTAA